MGLLRTPREYRIAVRVLMRGRRTTPPVQTGTLPPAGRRPGMISGSGSARRYAPGAIPNARLNALLSENSFWWPVRSAISASVPSVPRSSHTANASRIPLEYRLRDSPKLHGNGSRTPDGYIASLWQLSRIVTGAEEQKLFVDVDGVCVIYDLKTVPVTSSRTRESYRVRDGKIAWARLRSTRDHSRPCSSARPRTERAR
jgi:hypothetical protein